MPTIEIFKARYPQIKASDDLIGFCISDAQLEISKKAWGKFYEAGVLALAAHFASGEVKKGGGGNKQLASKKAGDIALGYAVITGKDAIESDYAATEYGRRYLKYKKLLGFGIAVITP